MPPLNALKAFEAAARHQQMSKAGDELHVTHAAISHQIKQLEVWLDTSLFHRKGRGIKLTRAGEMLYNCVHPQFEELSATCRMIKNMSGSVALRVGCIPSIASRWLVPHISAFSLLYPDVELRVQYAKADDKLDQSELDLLITYGEDIAPGVVSKRLFSRVNKPVCSPHYLRDHEPLDTPERIIAGGLLHDEGQQGWLDWRKKADLPGTESLSGPVFPDFNMLATAVIAGHGIALCPVEVFREEISRGDLLVLSEINTKADQGYFITSYLEQRPFVSEFVAWFTERLEAGC